MDLDLTDEQRALHEAIARIVNDYKELPRKDNVVEPCAWHYAAQMEHELDAGGFFEIALEESFTALEAALLVYETGFSPLVMEVAGSALIGPLMTGEALPRPIAVARLEDLTRGVRFLDRAQTLIVDLGDDVAILPASSLTVQPIISNYAYPLGKLAELPDFTNARRLGAGSAAKLRRLWRLGLALEIGSAMQAATEFTTEYVKQRQVFSRPLATFQAVQHRLSADAEKCRAVYWLCMKAAWSGTEIDAALAALHAQRAITQLIYDTHQFNGALGMTLEHKLHFWTFRLRWLMGELGGYRVQAADVSRLTWGNASVQNAA